jgi:hypothetical protein
VSAGIRKPAMEETAGGMISALPRAGPMGI